MIANLPSRQEKLAETMVKDASTRHAIMRRMVEQKGLRAQLTTGSLLTGQLYVALSYVPKAPKATFNANATPLEIPSVPSALPDLEAKLASIIAKLDRVPLDAIGEELKQDLATLDQTLRDASRMLNNFDAQVVPALKATLDDAKTAFGAAERMLTSTENNLVGAGAPGQVEQPGHAMPTSACPPRDRQASRQPANLARSSASRDASRFASRSQLTRAALSR